MEKILRLDLSGRPTSWLTREDAAVIYSKNLVRWELGRPVLVMLGGVNRVGERSSIHMSSVIATDGYIRKKLRKIESYSNRMLFKRDNYRCMYCGFDYPYSELTRDHIFPRSRGGKDVWENVVAACKRCNHSKADRTPEEANMILLAIPFRPNIFESMYLAQHQILADQMEYLEKQFSGNRKWNAA